MIVAIGAVGAAISWGWGGSSSNPPGWIGALLLVFFAVLPVLVLRQRPSVPLVGLSTSIAWLSAITMVTGPQPTVTASGASADVVPLVHLCGGGPTTDDPQMWSAIAMVCVVLGLAVGLALWAAVVLHNKRTLGRTLESVGWIDAYGVDKSAPRELPEQEDHGSSLYDPTLGSPAPGLRWTPRDRRTRPGDDDD